VTDAELAAAVAAAVSAVLGFPTGTPPVRVIDAAAAAVAMARRYLFAGDDLTLIPDGPDVVAGLTALAVRIYHDPASPAGIMGADAYTGPMIPEDMLAHVHHYLDPYRTGWGIA